MQLPLISIVIPCYNHGQYLRVAIRSILMQDYKPVEILVVDDGSIDNTKLVVSEFPTVKYIYQSNQGLSSARNTGIDHSSGVNLLFVDADDWLLPLALSTNNQFLEKNVDAAFVSGGFKIITDKGEVHEITEVVEKNHFQRLLEFNYIAMHATVLYRRWIFNEFRFDVTLKACEDYDMYLRVARKYPVVHHTLIVAAYRFHSTNMSYNTLMMMETAIKIIKKQEAYLVNKEEKESLKKGIKNWKLHYSKVIYGRYFLPEHKNNHNRKKEMKVLWVNNKSLYFRFYLKKLLKWFQGFLKGLGT